MREIKLKPVEDSTSVVICADISGSMQGAKIGRLRIELSKLWPEIKARLIVFNYDAMWIDGPEDLPMPEGGTNIAAALNLAATVWPSEVIVISDGLPQNEQAALNSAARLPGTISVLFVGNDDDYKGAEFMRHLALVGGGMYAHRDLAKNLAIGDELRGMLALPPPIHL